MRVDPVRPPADPGSTGTGDLRTIGSGNIGATNVLRTGRKDLAAATLLLDALKGTAAVLIAAHFFGERAALAAARAPSSAISSRLVEFRGGKGVATFLGCLIGVDLAGGAGLRARMDRSGGRATRFYSAAALTASVLAPLALVFVARPSEAALVFALLAALLWLKHRANLEMFRLAAGTRTHRSAEDRRLSDALKAIRLAAAATLITR